MQIAARLLTVSFAIAAVALLIAVAGVQRPASRPGISYSYESQSSAPLRATALPPAPPAPAPALATPPALGPSPPPAPLSAPALPPAPASALAPAPAPAPGRAVAEDPEFDLSAEAAKLAGRDGTHAASTTGTALQNATGFAALNLSFAMHVPGSLHAGDVQWCAGSDEPPMESIKPLPAEQKVLFILGAQKAGTTWLFNALTKHSALVGASRGYLRPPGPWAKELHFFDRWPAPPVEEFLPCFPDRVSNATHLWSDGSAADSKVLIDASPNYLYNAAAPPRIKAAIPHAKFVIVLRDPVARAYSAWKMTRRAMCPDETQPCSMRDFAANADASILAGRQTGCLFDSLDDTKTWHTCFQCVYSKVDKKLCAALAPADRQAFEPCSSARGFNMVDVSNYAAQIGWWLSFFPPERFIVLTSQELRDEERQLQAMNGILKHVSVGSSEPFTKDMLGGVHGYDGGYSADLSESEAQAVERLRKASGKQLIDLDKLLAKMGMDAFFSGLPAEI